MSVDDRPSSILATIRLQTNSESPVKLQFASGQEYELVLSTSDGKVVWKWSTGAVFIASLHTRTVNGEWSTTVEVPRPLKLSAAGPDTYALQAWLTTIGETPQFSATVPVTIRSFSGLPNP